MLIKGADLSYRQETLVKAAFIYRWTHENPMRSHAWALAAGGHAHACPTLPLQHDNEWIAQHAFHFVKDGSRLSHRKHFAEPVYVAD